MPAAGGSADGEHCGVCGGDVVDLAVESTDAVPPPAEPSPVAPKPPPPKKKSRLSRAVQATLILLVTFGVIGYLVWSQLLAQAPDPVNLIQRFDEAGIECTEIEKGLDFVDSKSASCFAGGKSFSVITSKDDVEMENRLNSQCAVLDANPMLPRTGAIVYTDHWTIDVQRLVRRGETAERTANRLAEVFDAEVLTYDCR